MSNTGEERPSVRQHTYSSKSPSLLIIENDPLPKEGRGLNLLTPLLLTSALLFGGVRLDLHEHDEQGKEHQRFDQSQTENHHRLDTTGSAGITRRAFDG